MNGHSLIMEWTFAVRGTGPHCITCSVWLMLSVNLGQWKIGCCQTAHVFVKNCTKKVYYGWSGYQTLALEVTKLNQGICCRSCWGVTKILKYIQLKFSLNLKKDKKMKTLHVTSQGNNRNMRCVICCSPAAFANYFFAFLVCGSWCNKHHQHKFNHTPHIYAAHQCDSILSMQNAIVCILTL